MCYVPQYRQIYRDIKVAEKEVLTWISNQSPPTGTGQTYSYTQYGRLAGKLGNKRVYLPKNLMDSLKLALEGRVSLARHHMEQGDADTTHGHPIEMLKAIAVSLCHPEAVQEVSDFLKTAQIDYRPSTSPELKTETTYYQGAQQGGFNPYSTPQLWYDESGVAYPVYPTTYYDPYYQPYVGQQQYGVHQGFQQNYGGPTQPLGCY